VAMDLDRAPRRGRRRQVERIRVFDGRLPEPASSRALPIWRE
jgi:hypothetical protein